jgi:2-oxo-4-hydroxy-4-carboxy--5-ureidoimidazoline (OHCU) decarboxylase
VAAAAAARANVLKHAVSVHEVLRNIYEEISWSDNEEILAIVPDLGQDLTSVKRLQKKHQVNSCEIFFDSLQFFFI